MQVVIEKLQAGAHKAQAVACKLETAQSSAQGEEALVSLILSYIKAAQGALPLICSGCISGLCLHNHLQSRDMNADCTAGESSQ